MERTQQAIRLKPDDVMFFNRQLASLARLGMPISKGLRILARDVKDGDFRALIESVQQDLDEGVSLQEALGKYPETFSQLHLEIVRAGESTGNLALILDELNSHTQAMQRIKGRILEAIVYPALISAVVLSFVMFFLLFIAPEFEVAIRGRSAAMAGAVSGTVVTESEALRGFPLTRLLFDVSRVVRQPIALALIAVGSIGGLVLLLRRIRKMGDEWDDLLFRIPLFGKLFEGAALMKITRTMRDLLQNGVSMVESLRLAARTVGQNRLQEKLDELRLAVEEGGSFSRNLAGGEVFPDTMVWKLQMAEEKGIIEQALEELTNEFELVVDRQTVIITKVLSPVLLLAMGGVVFLMFRACFVPLTTVG